MNLQNRKSRRPIPTLLSCALAGCLALAAPAVLAQSTAATLRGTVTADAVPAANAEITATNLANGYTSRAKANANGDYVLAGLQPGSYRIDVSANGKTSSQTVTLAVGQIASLDLPVGAAAATPTTLGKVVVTGVALQETKTSEVATYISAKQIDALPQSGRNFLAFADTIPGVVFSTETDGSVKLRGGAQSSNGINVFIDGVGQKNYVVKGGITGQDSSRGNPFPQLAIAEYKVITSNYKAEYDQLSSAAITAVTRSGSNSFTGSVFYDYTDDNLRQASLREIANDQKVASSDKQFGLSLGGPIIQDRMHFFFSYEGKQIESPREIRLGQNVTIAQLPSDLQALANATTGAPFQEDLYFGKIDWQVTDNQRVELTAKYRTEDELTNVGNGPNTASYGTVKKGDETRIDLHHQYSAERWLNDAHLTFEDASFGPRPATIGPGSIYTSDFDGGHVVINTGGGRDFQDKGQRGVSFQDDVTFFDLQWAGNHTIKTGMKYKAITINAFEQQPFNPQFTYNLSSSLTVPYQVQFGAVTGGGDRDITSRNKQFGIYLQDDWEVNEHLLLNLGVRWDYEQTPGYYDYVTPAGLATALRGWSNIHAPGVDYDIEDYISSGSNRDAFKGAWQPRVGFSYDFNADQRHVIFGGAGRSYDRNLFDYLALEQSKSTFPSYGFNFNVPGRPCTVGVGNCLAWDPAYYDSNVLAALVAANPNLGAEVNLMNNDLKTPYSDQLSVGMRNAFKLWGNDWNSSVTLSHIVSHDGIVFTLGNRYPGGTFRDPNCVGATWGCQPWGFPIPGYGTLILADNGIETKNNSLLVSLEKLYSEDSKWGLTLAYTFNDASENRGHAYESDEHYLFDYPNLEGVDFMRSLGLARHRLVATTIIGNSHGFTFSSKLTLASPTPKEALNCHDAIDFNHCFFDPFTPGETIGYKQWDVSLQQEWNTFGDVKFRIRADILNVMNWRNYTDYDTWRGGPSPDFNPNFGTRNGNGTLYPEGRIIKLTAGLSW